MTFESAEEPPVERLPLTASCNDCKHQWVAMYLPMELARAAKILKGLCCPSCGAPAKHIRILGNDGDSP